MQSQDMTPQSRLSQMLAPVRNSLFGRQNERLEYIMDSFFKLPPEQRAMAVIGSVIGFILLIASFVWLYLAALSGLQSELDSAFVSMNKFREVQVPFSQSKQKLQSLTSRLSINQSVSLVTLIEDKAKKMGITVDFPSQPSMGSPSATLKSLTDYQVGKVTFSVSKVGLPRLIEFIVELEGMPNLLHITGLKIVRGFTDKLYLDAEVDVEAFVPQKK